MTWMAFAFLAAFFESGKDVLCKKGLQRSDEYIVAWAWRFFALPFLLPLLLFIDIPALDAEFWWALLVGGGLNMIAAILYMKAIKRSDLSVTVPMVTFTPLFLLFTSPLLVGEFPGAYGLTGVVLIVLGSYLLNIKKRAMGCLAPFKALITEQGPRLMLLVALLWSVTANVDKIGLKHSSPLFWAIAVNTFIACGLLPLALYRMRNGFGRSKSNFKILLVTGFCGGMTTICQMIAISLTLVPHVIAIKRTSTMMSVLWGHFLFGERGLRQRFLGVFIMILGALFITLS
jgi:drug/metabolite transporter (DMT)-like permease